MRRRDFIALAGGAAVWTVAARAQKAATPVIGLLSSESPDSWADRVHAFHQGLDDAGYVEGRSVAIEYRWAEGQNDRLRELVSDLIRRQVALIFASGGTSTPLAAKLATTTTPILFAFGGDPVRAGLVSSLSHPGGNTTGATTLNLELGPKRLELLHELIPAATTIGFLVNPTSASAQSQTRDLRMAAQSRGLELHVLRASTESDFEKVFATLRQLRVSGLVISPDPFFSARGEQLGALTVKHTLPAIYLHREFTAGGGLLSHGGSTIEAHRLAGVYAGRILKGANPADLPVQQATKLELIINMKTAKALGLDVPPSVLVRANEVIE